ncbi:MAG: hypothetical protein LBR76_07875 [Oscillospiraceae bacterium]|jgi:rod shape-determining protein MreD|nr:hypothetical protein [Oscillospiraceae bacterium]
MTIQRLLKGICFGVLTVLAAVLQTEALTRVPAVPNALVSVPAVVALAIFTGPVGGGAAGLICGLLCDAMTPTVEALFALTLMTAGIVTGLLCVRILQKTFWSALLITSVSAVLIEFLLFLIFYLIPGRTIWAAFLTVGLPEALAGIVCLLPLYPLFRGVSRLFTEEG